MNNRVAFLKRASVVQVKVFVTSLAIAVAGLIGIPVADAFQTTAGLPVSTDHGPQVGHSIGRIQKLDIERADVTLKHGPIASLGMPDMTMIFRVANPQQLMGLKVGDEVRFEVQSIRGAIVISKIDRAR